MQPLKYLTLTLVSIIQINLVSHASSDFPNLTTLKQAVPSLTYTRAPITQKLNFLSAQKQTLPVQSTYPSGSTPEAAARRFLVDYGQLFGVTNQARELKVLEEKTDSLGMTHLRFEQRYKTVPIFGSQLLVHLNNKQTVVAANGYLLPNIELATTTPSLNSNQAKKKAEELWGQQFNSKGVNFNPPRLYVFNPQLLTNKPDQTYLVWEVEGFGYDRNNFEQREFFYLNAHTNQLVFQITGIVTARNRNTHDCNYSTSSCPLVRSEGQGPIGIAEIDNLHDYVGNTYDYFWNSLGRDSFDNNGATIRADGRYGTMANAGWTGTKMIFGPGFGVKDVVAHEFTHGVNDYTAGSIYYGESGALSESYSDVFGAAIDNNDWQMGEDTPIGAIRDLANPSSLFNSGLGIFYPDRFYDDPNFYCGSGDNAGVHHNSTVPSHAAYLVSQGGTHNGCTINAIGRSKEEVIWYRTLAFYLTSNSKFNDNYTLLIQSCIDLYGTSSFECIELTKALQAVEMDQPGKCSGIPRQTPACASGTTPTPTSVLSPTPTPTPTPSPTPTPISTPTPSPTPLPTNCQAADLDTDGKIDANDLNIVFSNFYSLPPHTCPPSVPNCQPDLNGDGVINSIDVSIIISCWTG